MELKSELENINFPENKEYQYKLSALMGSGQLSLTYGKLNSSEYIVHVQATAGMAMFPKFHFEGLSKWEKNGNKFEFVSYEEKDFSKQIHKKYEITHEGLNYVENKKGLVVEREVQYFSTPEGLDRLFDPMSAAALYPLELSNNESKNLFILGKQRIISVVLSKADSLIKVKSASGTNANWEKILNEANLFTNELGIIETIELPLPMGIGKVKLKLDQELEVSEKDISEKIEKFHLEF